MAKDHDDHPFHILASQMAMEMIRDAGMAMVHTWSGRLSKTQLTQRTLRYIVHPAHININDADGPAKLVRIAQEWAKDPANQKKIDLVSNSLWISHIMSRHRKGNLDMDNYAKYLMGYGDAVIEKIETFRRGVV